MAKLQTLSGPLGTPAFELTGQFITIGRAHGNTIHLNHRSVSKYHAMIVVDDGQPQLFDLHSTNGTYVNKQHTSCCPLNPNDEILMGEFVFRYEVPGVPIPVPVKAPAALPAQDSITPEVLKKLAVSGPRKTTGSIKPAATPPPLPAQPAPAAPERSFIKVPAAPPPPPPPPPAPVETISAAPTPPAEDQVLQTPAPDTGKGDGLLLKKPSGDAGGEKLLIKRGGAPVERILKKPGTPKDEN